jgi:hypothetical protein
MKSAAPPPSNSARCSMSEPAAVSPTAGSTLQRVIKAPTVSGRRAMSKAPSRDRYGRRAVCHSRHMSLHRDGAADE